ARAAEPRRPAREGRRQPDAGRPAGRSGRDCRGAARGGGSDGDRVPAPRAGVARRIAASQEGVEAAPRREQEVLGLMRDYQKLSENYSQLLSKKLDAEMAARLERQQKGQPFPVLDPAYLPEQPSFPNRGMFALFGVGVGIVLGIGLAITVDALDPTIKDAESVRTAFNFPVLAVIPYVKPRDQARLAKLPLDAPAGTVGGGKKKRRGGGGYRLEGEA